ncbi:hypothetical protein AB1N83_013902 [Pleurotus pulmonarius]
MCFIKRPHSHCLSASRYQGLHSTPPEPAWPDAQIEHVSAHDNNVQASGLRHRRMPSGSVASALASDLIAKNRPVYAAWVGLGYPADPKACTHWLPTFAG